MMAKRMDPADDPNSIGNLLMRGGLGEHRLARAVAFQKDHPDIMLGEACVRLGFISRCQLEVAVAIQESKTNGGTKNLARLAASKTRELGERIDRLVLTGDRVLATLAK